jgi:radical SAM protein (TIGR01212 family)
LYYCSLDKYLKNRFGCKVYKLALSANVTCPNRDGTKGERGCIFCSAGGSGEFAASPALPVTAQIDWAKQKIQAKTQAQSYIAYFQSFTNTYADISYLEEIFTDAVYHPQVAALSIATRPDCLPADVLRLIERLCRIKPVFVELGLQTIHEETARYIRRGYDLPCYDEAVRNLLSAGAEPVVHIILGLPRETRAQMLETVSYAGRSGAKGIKLQLLHVLSGTDLAADYERGMFKTMALNEYACLLCECIELLPRDMVIHRLTGDGDKKLLIAPEWSGDKKRVWNTIQRAFREKDVEQGRHFRP